MTWNAAWALQRLTPWVLPACNASVNGAAASCYGRRCSSYQGAGVLVPLALGLIGFGLVWLTVGGFYDRAFIAEIRSRIAETLGFDVSSPYVVMLILLLAPIIHGFLVVEGLGSAKTPS